jgi:hypothetical protein
MRTPTSLKDLGATYAAPMRRAVLAGLSIGAKASRTLDRGS